MGEKPFFSWNYVSVVVLCVSLIVVSVAALFCGRYHFDISGLQELLQNGLSKMDRRVLFHIRLPRIVFALAAGAALASAGATLQGVCANPLASPDTLGVASGASFGAALSILLGANGFGIQVSAMLFGIAAAVFVFFIAWKRRQHGILFLVLAGMVIGSFFSACLSFVKYIADPQDTLPSITYWLMGGMNSVTWKTVRIGLPWIVLGGAGLLLIRWKMNAMSLSEEEAYSLGIPVKQVRGFCIIMASMITAAVIAACGQIGWVGLLIPHCCRLLFGNDQKKVIPASMLLGAGFLLIMDTIARCMTAAEIPVSILTSMVGAPFFLFLLCRGRE